MIFSVGYSCFASLGWDIHTSGGFSEACRCVKGCLYSAAVSGSKPLVGQQGAPAGLSPIRLTDHCLISLPHLVRRYSSGCIVCRGSSHRTCMRACTWTCVFAVMMSEDLQVIFFLILLQKNPSRPTQNKRSHKRKILTRQNNSTEGLQIK